MVVLRIHVKRIINLNDKNVYGFVVCLNVNVNIILYVDLIDSYGSI